MKYTLPNIPGHVAGKKATLTINDGETMVSGRISHILLSADPVEGSAATITFDTGCIEASVRENTPHELEVEE